jgi:hypothetical protein
MIPVLSRTKKDLFYFLSFIKKHLTSFVFKQSGMVKNCKCELLSQVFVGGYVLKGMSAEEIEVVVNRCSVVKCKYVYTISRN